MHRTTLGRCSLGTVPGYSCCCGLFLGIFLCQVVPAVWVLLFDKDLGSGLLRVLLVGASEG